MTIKLTAAEYRYDQGFHLKPVSFEIEPGNFIVLTGPNGSGKTTLFSLINGVVKPSSGSVTVGKQDVSGMSARARARFMGMVPQVSRINFDYTVEELIAMGRYPYQGFFCSESDEDRRVIDEVITRLDLSEFRERSISCLSGGEYQRVLLARVLVQQTDILLLDEPGNHLDLKHQTMLLNLLKEEVGNGKTVIAVLHDLNQALLYADYGVLLDRGECVRLGSPSEILTADIIQEVFGVTMKEYRNDEGAVLFAPETGASESAAGIVHYKMSC